MLKLTTDKHEASRGLSATAELLVAKHHTLSFITDQRTIVFYKKIMYSNISVMSTPARLHVNDIIALSSTHHAR